MNLAPSSSTKLRLVGWARPSNAGADAELSLADAAWSRDALGDAALSRLQETACDGCGGDLAFAPSIRALLCEHCGKSQAIAPSAPDARRAALAELDYEAALATAEQSAPTEETRVRRCGSCGAESVFEPADRAKPCAFCGAALTSAPIAVSRIEPRSMAPFKIDAREARARLEGWLGDLWFAPRELEALARSDRPFTGVYAPIYTFDAITVSRYRGARGDVHVDHVWRTIRKQGRTVRKRVPVQKVRWRPASGRIGRRFNDLATPAGVGVDRSLFARLQARGLDLSAFEPVRKEYMAGFIAEAPSVGLEEGFSGARRAMDDAIAQAVRADIGGDLQRIERIDTDVSEIRFRSALTPVWVTAYEFDGNSYQALVDGLTGRVVGQRPYSKTKIALAVVGAALAAIGLWAGLSALYGA